MKKAFITNVVLPVRVVVEVDEEMTNDDLQFSIAQAAVAQVRDGIEEEIDYPYVELVSQHFEEDHQLPYPTAPEDSK